MKKVILFSVFVFVLFSAFAQGVAIGQWRDHLSYRKAVAVAVGANNIYCATNPGMFYYDTQDHSISRLNKTEGLSDVVVNSMAYASTYDIQILGYSNGNIDLIMGKQIFNIPDIKRSALQGNKAINHIFVSGSVAYLSCGFGIVVLDLVKKEIKDTYKIGSNGGLIFVNEIEVYHDKIYAATAEGMYTASVYNTNLSAFQSWSKAAALPSGNFNTVAVVNDLLYTNFDKANVGNQDTLYVYNNSTWSKPSLGAYYNNSDIKDINTSASELLVCLYGKAWVLNSDYSLKYEFKGFNVDKYPDWATVARPMEMVEKNGEYWMADSLYGLIHFKGAIFSEQLIPNGPSCVDVWELKAKHGKLWVATGSYSNAMNPVWSNIGFYSYDGTTWTTYNDIVTPNWVSVRDLICVAPHPTEDNTAYLGSFGYGMIEISKGAIVAGYNSGNSSLKDYNGAGAALVTGLDFDANNNLWVLNSGMPGALIDVPLHVLKNGKLMGFKIPGITSSQSIFIKLMIDSHGNKWIIKTKSGSGVVVAKEKDANLNSGTAFDTRHFSILQGSGKLPSERVNDIVEDKKGKIWMATDQGVAVVDNPAEIFTAANYDVQQILIQEGGVWHHLLESERVTAIAVDGGNKKWFGTDGSGVFQLSEDGTKQLQHFTTENSALISNSIIDIAIDDVTGEVFFGTDKGIVSFRGTATEGAVSNGPVYAYPNPVKHDFTGTIGIKGLVNNAMVKITDVTGVLVYETKAEGGQATWDGKRNGERVQTGVYLVFISNDDGTETTVAKIMFIN